MNDVQRERTVSSYLEPQLGNVGRRQLRPRAPWLLPSLQDTRWNGPLAPPKGRGRITVSRNMDIAVQRLKATAFVGLDSSGHQVVSGFLRNHCGTLFLRLGAPLCKAWPSLGLRSSRADVPKPGSGRLAHVRVCTGRLGPSAPQLHGSGRTPLVGCRSGHIGIHT